MTTRTVSTIQRRAEIIIATPVLIIAATAIYEVILRDPILIARDYLSGDHPNRGVVALFENILLPFWLFFNGFIMPEEHPIPTRSST